MAQRPPRTRLDYFCQTTKKNCKTGFLNAFKELDRSAINNELNFLIPQLGRFVRSCYVKLSTLDMDGQTLLSERGVQQGDPLGTFLFAKGIEHLSSAPHYKFGV